MAVRTKSAQTINRKALIAELAKPDDDSKLVELQKAVFEARKAYEKWDEPRRKLREAIEAAETEASRIDGTRSHLIGQLQADAVSIIEPVRHSLSRQLELAYASFQPHTAAAVEKRVAALKTVIKRLDDEAAIAPDVRQAVDEILSSIPALSVEY